MFVAKPKIIRSLIKHVINNGVYNRIASSNLAMRWTFGSICVTQTDRLFWESHSSPNSAIKPKVCVINEYDIKGRDWRMTVVAFPKPNNRTSLDIINFYGNDRQYAKDAKAILKNAYT